MILKQLYKNFRKVLPERLKGYTTKSLYNLGVKPRVNKNANSKFPSGIVVLSIDFEMSWAFMYSKGVLNHVEFGLRERMNVSKIIKLLEKYKIPATWATVGHLFLESCEKQAEKSHPDMPRPQHYNNKNWDFKEGDWYQYDPGTDYKRDPAWYAPDLIDLILRSGISHEIGCHTFSHIDFTDKNCSKELAEKELQMCKLLAEKKNIKLKSIVFPGGTAGNYPVLKKEGFICYRKPNSSYDIDVPVIDENGLVAISSSLGLDRSKYDWGKDNYILMVKKHIESAVKYKMVSHFWFHPSMNKWYLNNVFPEILKFISEQRKEKKIEVLTMGELGLKVLSDNK